MIAQPGNIDSTLSSPLDRLDGDRLLAAFAYAAKVVAAHREQLNALNVFPVPDDDTGTNLAVTLWSAIETANKLAPDSRHRAGDVMAKIAYGALMGARGNSGVILAQILHGIAAATEHESDLEGPAIARALTHATEVAYQAVVDPVEGTMLTVIADAARAATAALATGADAGHVLAAAADASAESLVHTPESLAVLRQAQVVDAGGQGVAYVLRALANHVHGDLTAIQIGIAHPVPALAGVSIGDADRHSGVSGYCTNFIVVGNKVDLGRFREQLGSIGDSVVIVGDAELFKVHVHTDRPERAVALGLAHGSIDRVAIENMARQANEAVATIDAHQRATTALPTARQAVVATAGGPGLADALRSMGAAIVMRAADGSGPSAADLLQAVEAAPANDVILLPNDSEAIATADVIRSLTSKRVNILPSSSVAQAIAALAAMGETADFATNTDAMTRALATATWADIATADTDTVIDGIDVNTGDVLCFVNGTLHGASSSLTVALTNTLTTAPNLDPDICTVFTGQDADETTTVLVAQTLSTLYPQADIETVDGGQSSFQYVIAFE